MSAPEPTVPNTIDTAAPDPPYYKFPPFPEPPPGVTIMPFKDFKARGIQLFSESRKGDDVADEEDAELDALGIPTVELRVKHSTDECKSSSRKKRKKKKTTVVEAVPVKKLQWYEEWEEGEDLRVTKVRYDSNTSPVDRFYQAAFDFRTGRPWPPIALGLNNLWDQFRSFTGLLISPSVFRKASGRKEARAESPDFESDDQDDLDTNGDSRPSKRQRSGEGLDDDDESLVDDPHKLDEDSREEKVINFLSDPEKAARIFFSSFMRERGLIWTERHLHNAPRLIAFFLAFVLRNRVLPEPAYQRGLKKALEIIEWAKKELPLTHTVGQSIPDAFNNACREFFGRKGGINWTVANPTTTTTMNVATDREGKETSPSLNHFLIHVSDTTITVTDITSGVKTNLALPTDAEMILKEVIEDNTDMDVSINTSSTLTSPVSEAPTAGGWAAGGWGNVQNDGGGNATSWDQNAWAQGESWGTWSEQPQEGQGTNGETTGGGSDTKWADSKPSWMVDPSSLLPLLGPSAFPLTHTTGIVECSTRRVSAIHFPPNHPKGVPLASSDDRHRETTTESHKDLHWVPSASAVEEELDARFAKVVLEPWGCIAGDISEPEIWCTSRGPVIDPKNPPAETTEIVSRKPHNPLTDIITLLVEPSFAETLGLVPGLGLGAMWIEIVRQKNIGGAGASVGDAQVDENTRGRFWYHEDVTGIFPSFYTPGEQKE
ncbi:hypothetical protein JVU11DRAFT_2101 [Chiua virens]|nr:hypothetical protein JVU11DRAFT_2101 [Chiua virens]